MSSSHWPDIERVLATVIELPKAERRARLDELCAGRPNLRAEVESLLAAHESADSFMEGGVRIGQGVGSRLAMTGTRLGQYQLLEVLGHGGMGTVYRAERTDGRFQKQVAIKIAFAALHSPELRQRFASEQQILASLEHSNIGRLLDAGVSPEGIPYLVMEYVEGIAVNEYCRGTGLSTRERLKLFQKICSAVHYAHQRLVVHRDIKPANILVRSDGTPKLLDFGVAKILDPRGEPALDLTRSLLNPMTPSYASPEQARGERLTTATDVYSLGVVLYELVTEKLPYALGGKSFEEALRIIKETEPEKPTAVVRLRERNSRGQPHPVLESSADIDAIVAKAMRKDAHDRYASAQELSDDVTRYLEGLPVSAHRGTFRYLAGKFVSRNKLAVSVSLGVIVLTLAGVSAVMWQARVAQRERAKAQSRFDQVRSLAKSLIFEVHDSVRDLPGATSARKLIVTRALQYLDGLSQEPSGDVSLQRELADAYERVGDVQDNPQFANLGDFSGAAASYGKALAIRESLLRADPENAALKTGASGGYWKLGQCLDANGDFSGALANLRKALSLTEQVADTTKDPAVADRLAGDHWAIAKVLYETGDVNGAVASYRKAAEVREAIRPTEPSQIAAIQMHLAGDYFGMAQTLLKQGQSKDALEAGRRSAEILAGLSKDDPSNVTLRNFLAGAQTVMGDCLLELGSPNSALGSYRQALAIYEASAMADPADTFSHRLVGYTKIKIGDALVSEGNAQAGLQELTTALNNFEQLARQAPESNYLPAVFGNTYSGLGMAHATLASDPRLPTAKRREHWREARLWYAKSLEIWVALKRQGKLASDEIGEPDRIPKEIAKCDQALKRLPIQ